MSICCYVILCMSLTMSLSLSWVGGPGRAYYMYKMFNHDCIGNIILKHTFRVCSGFTTPQVSQRTLLSVLVVLFSGSVLVLMLCGKS